MATIARIWWPVPKGGLPRQANDEIDEDRCRELGLRSAWQVTFTDQAGKRVRKNFSRRRDADAELVKARGQVQAGTFTRESTSATLGDACKAWLQRGEAEGLEPSTIEQYKLHVRQLGAVIADTTKLAKLSTARCEQVRDDLVSTHNRPTARKILTTFKAVVKDAKRRGMIAHNPAADTAIGAGKRHQKRLKAGEHFPEPGEVKAMLASGDAKGTALVALAALAGLRASELRGLPWSDVDLGPEPSVTVRQRADRWGSIGSPKSADAARTVPLGETAKQALRAWKVAQPPVVTRDADGKKVTRPHVLVFGTASDRADMLNNLQRRLLDPLQIKAGIVDAAGLARYSFHALRHYAVSSWLASGNDMKECQGWAGHATLALTLDTYGHLIPRANAHARMADAERLLHG